MSYPYEALLKRARKQAPEISKSEDRFVIPQFDSYVEGSRTIITNFSKVIKKLNRKPRHLILFLSKELATSFRKEGENYVLSGKISGERINNKLRKYVEMYVICPTCRKPDTKLIKEKAAHILKCEVCGAMTPVRKV